MSQLESSEQAPEAARSRQHDGLALLEDVPQAIVVEDARGRLWFANALAAELCGFDSPEAMLAAEAEDWVARFEPFDEAGRPVASDELPGRRVLAGHDAKERLLRFRHCGEERWVWVAARKLRGTEPPLAVNVLRDATLEVHAERIAAQDLHLARALERVVLALASELDHDKLVQRITDEATAICGAAFGAFFHNVTRDDGESYLLYTLSGAPREAFEQFGQPRATPVFAPTFRGEGPVRSGDITKDPRYGKMSPHHGMPKGHLPVVSYLAVPVVAASGEVLGGLFFGHPERDRFTEAHERAVSAIAAHAAVALEKARLFRRVRANEAALMRSERRFRSLVLASSQTVWVSSPSGEVKEDSPTWRAFTGQTFEEWEGTGWADAIHPDDRARALATWRKALAEQASYETEYRLRKADGTYANTVVRGTPLKGESGEVQEWISFGFDITDRVRAEDALRDNERKLRLALEVGRMGTWEYDLTANRVFWSPQVERLHGLEPGSFDGTFVAYQRDIHPEDRDRVLETIARNVREGRQHALLYRIVRADGAVRWLEAFGTFTHDATGQPTKLLGVCSDVTERIQAQEARSALRIQKMLEGISDAFAVYDSSWTVVFANEASTAALGLKPQDVLGKNVWQLVPDVIGTRFHTELLRVLETGRAAVFEERYAPLGLWFEVHAYPVADVGIAVYSRDVTARRREQAIQERLARYRELVAEIGAVLSSRCDVSSMLQRCCEAIVKWLGVAFARVWLVDASGEWLELKASAGLYTHLDGPHARVRIGELKIGRIAAERAPHLTNDVCHDPWVGDREWAKREGLVAFAGYPLIVDDRLVGVLATFAKEPLAEDTLVALGSAGDTIAQGAERAHAELALAEHARELARSNADLEQFAYVASHDLQEPLRMVASYVQLLDRRYRDKLDDDAREFIGFAVEGVTRMRRLIEDLLAYSRIGTRGREPTRVDLAKVVETAEKNLAGSIEEAGAVITHEPFPELVGDEGQLVQVFQNLLGNAVKFRRDEPPRIHVGARRDKDEWVFSVRDNGIGIDSQYVERIFVIFQRLNPRERYPGTGIGLAITKKIIERHGGRIWVESAPGRGSTISFTLPSAPRVRR